MQLVINTCYSYLRRIGNVFVKNIESKIHGNND
jgi:hypothetical protein